MAKVRGVNEAALSISKRIRGALAGSKELGQAGDKARKIFRSGRLLDGSSIKPLAASTVEARRRLAKVNTTSKFYSPAKSNLTFSGQFLESLKTQVSRARDKIQITIFPNGIHKGPKTLRGKRQKGVSNLKLAQYLKDGGRDISRVGDEFTREIKKIIIKALKNAR